MAKGHLDDLLPPLTADDIALMDDDLARLTELTGRSEVLAISGGPIMALWGVVMPLTSLAFILRYIDILPPWLPVTPLQGLFGYGGTVIILALRARNLKVNAWQSHAMFTIWAFGGGGLFVYNLGTIITRQVNMMLNTAVQCIIFSVTIAVMGAAGRRRWLLMAAIGWMATAFAMFFLSDVVARQSALAVASVLFMLVPGIILSFNRKSL